MATYGGYQYYIDEISSKYNDGFIRFRDMIEMDNNRIINVANPIEDMDAINSITADIRYPRKTTDNVFTGNNIFNGNTVLADAVITNLSVTNILLNGDIIPNDDDTYNLGSTTKRFKNLFLTEGMRIDGNTTGQDTNWIHLYDYGNKQRVKFEYNGSNQSHSITHLDKNGVIKKYEQWSHTSTDNFEIIGGSINDRMGNSILSVIGDLGVSGDTSVGGTLGVSGDTSVGGTLRVSDVIFFNQGGATDPHIGWETNTINLYANDFKFYNTAGTQNLADITAYGLRMRGRDVYDTADVIPFSDNAYDIGTSTKGYKDLYLKGKRYNGNLLMEDTYYNTSKTIVIPAPDAGGNTISGVACHTYLQNIIDSLPKFIPEYSYVIIQFSAGTYNFGDNKIYIKDFYGGGGIIFYGDGGFSTVKRTTQSTILIFGTQPNIHSGFLNIIRCSINTVRFSNLKIVGSIDSVEKSLLFFIGVIGRVDLYGNYFVNSYSTKTGSATMAFSSYSILSSYNYVDNFDNIVYARERSTFSIIDNSYTSGNDYNYLARLSNGAIVYDGNNNSAPLVARSTGVSGLLVVGSFAISENIVNIVGDQTYEGVKTFLDNVGIGTTPAEKLHVSGGNFLVEGTHGTSPVLSESGAGTKAFFYPRKSAFRAGYVVGSKWDDAIIGNYSTAMGYDTTANNIYSTAIGYITTASGGASTAIGYITTASGDASTAIGNEATASGFVSTAIGNVTTASGDYSTAMGYGTTASGGSSTAMGFYTTASGNYSTTMGYNTTASGNYSTAMGSNARAAGDYCFAINLNAGTQPDVGSYTFRIDGAATIGGNVAWTNYSDKRLKEDIKELKSELDKINKLRPVSFKWKEVNEGVEKVDNLGLIAQEVREIYPEVVKGIEEKETLSLEYTGLIAPLIKAVQELSEQNKKLFEKIETLESKLKEN